MKIIHIQLASRVEESYNTRALCDIQIYILLRHRLRGYIARNLRAINHTAHEAPGSTYVDTIRLTNHEFRLEEVTDALSEVPASQLRVC